MTPDEGARRLRAKLAMSGRGRGLYRVVHTLVAVGLVIGLAVPAYAQGSISQAPTPQGQASSGPTPGNDPLIVVDAPTPGANVPSTTRISGWAVNRAAPLARARATTRSPVPRRPSRRAARSSEPRRWSTGRTLPLHRDAATGSIPAISSMRRTCPEGRTPSTFMRSWRAARLATSRTVRFTVGGVPGNRRRSPTPRPSNVIAVDNFDDPAVGIMPRESSDPTGGCSSATSTANTRCGFCRAPRTCCIPSTCRAPIPTRRSRWT